MKLIKALTLLICTITLLVNPALGGETCCQKAALEGKDCTHKCCVTAHKGGKSCVKCNPGKEDLKLKKVERKSNKPANKSTDKKPDKSS